MQLLQFHSMQHNQNQSNLSNYYNFEQKQHAEPARLTKIQVLPLPSPIQEAQNQSAIPALGRGAALKIIILQFFYSTSAFQINPKIAPHQQEFETIAQDQTLFPREVVAVQVVLSVQTSIKVV
ncbi:hypothetical protein ABPG74_010336 [Tetrahymena malaccensis]